MKKIILILLSVISISVFPQGSNPTNVWQWAGNSPTLTIPSLGTNNTKGVRFITNAVERMRISQNGAFTFSTGTTTSADILGWVTNETGTGVLVFNNSPTLITPSFSGAISFTQGITTPTVWGSSAAGGTLTILSTSSATPGVINMGMTSGTININSTYANISNSLNCGPNASNTTTLGGLSIGYNGASGIIHIGKYNATSNAIWLFHSATPTTSNYNINADANNLYFNTGTSLNFVTNNVTRAIVNSSSLTLSVPANITGSLSSTGNISSSSPTAGIGYAVGSGSTVTQATNRTTGVTINSITGAITLVSASGSASYQSFTVTNSSVSSKDIINIVQKSGTDKYIPLITSVSNGSFEVTFATTGGTTTEQPVFNFEIIKGQTN